MEKTNNQVSGISCRAVLIGFILVLPNSYWAIRRGIMWNGPPDIMSLHYNSVFTVFSLTIINLLFLKVTLFPCSYISTGISSTRHTLCAVIGTVNSHLSAALATVVSSTIFSIDARFNIRSCSSDGF
jgi:hypothetical protein